MRNGKTRKKEMDELGGIFNVLLIGENPHAISIADNIHSAFGKKTNMNTHMVFNIVDEVPCGSRWFNEFIFDMVELSRYNNIVVSSKFKKWNEGGSHPMEHMYMKKLLQAMNFVIIDISQPDGDSPTDGFGGGGGYETIFDNDVPQCRFNENTDFLGDVTRWIDGQISRLTPSMPMIRLVRSLCGKTIPYIGDVFGCLSGKKYGRIINDDKMRFDVPILFDEFCSMTRGMDWKEIDEAIVVRSNSALSSFFK